MIEPLNNMAKRVFTQTFGVVGAIIEKDGKILLSKQSASKKFDAGKYDLPAGWIDLGKNPLESVRREVEEETGYSFKPKSILGVYSLIKKDSVEKDGQTRQPIQIIFLGEISDKKARELADDVSETKWFTPEEIEKMDLITLRNADIKQMVKDYFAGKRYPLELLTHTVSE